MSRDRSLIHAQRYQHWYRRKPLKFSAYCTFNETCLGCCDTNNHTRSIPSRISCSTSAAGARCQRATLRAWFARTVIIYCSSSVCVAFCILETFALPGFVSWKSYQWEAQRKLGSNSLCRLNRLTTNREQQLTGTPPWIELGFPPILSTGAPQRVPVPLSYRRTC